MSDAKDSGLGKHGLGRRSEHENFVRVGTESNCLFLSTLSDTVQNFQSLSVTLNEAGNDLCLARRNLLSQPTVSVLCDTAPQRSLLATTVSNALIDCLPKRLQDSIRSKLEPVSLPSSTFLYRAGEKPKFAHFLTSGLASVVTSMTDGRTSEVGIWGRESLAESMHLLGPAKVPNNCFMQVPGTALRMRFSDLQEDFNSSEPIRNLVLQSIQIQGLTLEQLAACNRLHEAEERLARWLLMVEDRVGESSYSLTQEFLGDMLGARRTTVTLAAGTLQDSGLISYRRGRIRILDREKLEAVACECYQTVRKLWRGSCFELGSDGFIPSDHR